MKPLEKGQLKNWKEYLDFEIENGSHERVTVLFERCMIACALYEDFWLKVRFSAVVRPAHVRVRSVENSSTECVRFIRLCC